jgi:hypothetical protein
MVKTVKRSLGIYQRLLFRKKHNVSDTGPVYIPKSKGPEAPAVPFFIILPSLPLGLKYNPDILSILIRGFISDSGHRTNMC